MFVLFTALFEPSTLYVLRRCEQAKSLPRMLKCLRASTTNVISFVYKGASPLAALKMELTRLGAHFVPCFDPWPNEAPPVVQAMTLEKGLNLKPDAMHLVVEAVGTDLVKLDHEISKLALIFSASPESTVTVGAAEVAPHLDMIREDDTYQLDRLILQKDWARAHALANDLLERGEKPTALLAILANHCRNALRISAALRQGARAHELGAGLRMPPFLVKTYAQYLAGSDPKHYGRALARCREVDQLLESKPWSDTLLVASILDALA